MRRLIRAWKAYWLAPGGTYASAVARIALAMSLLWLLSRHGEPGAWTSERFYSHGLWLLTSGRPGAGTLAVITTVAWIASGALLLGAACRVAQPVAVIACTLIAAYGEGNTAHWSHADAPVLLVGIALTGAPMGAVWSIDAVVRRRRGRPTPLTRQTGVRLALFALASVFFVAGVGKLTSDAGFGLGWGLSDNLRHQLLVRYDWIGLPRTPLADWIIAESWRYRTVATLNLVSQVLPIAALGLFGRPRLRAALGVLFVLEVLGLMYVMDLSNPHWLPLAALFVDWDALVRKPVAEAPPVTRATRVHLGFATVFVAFYLLQAFWLNQRLHAYPFSGFPMFQQVRAKRPYDVHQSYEMLGGHIELEGAKPMSEDQTIWVAHHAPYRWMWRARDPGVVRAHLHTVLRELRGIWGDNDFTTARLSLAIFQAPAYPAPPALVRLDVGILGELAIDGTFRTRLGTLAPDGATILGEGIRSVWLSRDLDPVLAPAAAVPVPGGVKLAVPLWAVTGEPLYVVVEVTDGTRWVAGFRSRGRW